MTTAKNAVIPIVTRSDMDEGPSQKVVKVIRTISREGVNTPASLFAKSLFNERIITNDE